MSQPRWLVRILMVLLLAITSITWNISAQSLGQQKHERLFKRQTTLPSDEASIEVETTSLPSSPTSITPQPHDQGHSIHNSVTANGLDHGHSQHLPGSYHDMPRQPNFVPPFGLRDAGFVRPNPYAGRQPLRSGSGQDRLQAETFNNGLGRRLLAMIGLNRSMANGTAGALMEPEPGNPLGEVRKALQNSTVLNQLNQGVQSVYGGISRMYNSTVRQQLEIMRQKLSAMSANITDPWQKRMSQQVPQFFNAMMLRVNEAQENLNRAWRQMNEARNGTNGLLSSRSLHSGMMARSANMLDSPFNDAPGSAGLDPELDVDHFGAGRAPMMGTFFDNIGNSFGFGGMRGGQDGQTGGSRNQNFMTQMLDFWRNQIMPQIGMLQSQVSRIWRDLSQSGTLRPIESMRLQIQAGTTNVSAEVMDEVLKDVGAREVEKEFKLIDPATGSVSGGHMSSDAPAKMGNRMLERLTAMQRELNQLWMGLSSSINNAMSSITRGRTPGSGNGSNLADPVDSAENEINDKINNLNKLQRDADIVHDTIKRQQMMKEKQQQRGPNFTDRVRGFFNRPEISNNVGRLRDSIGATYSQIESAVGDLWSGIPDRWDNFMRPQDITSMSQSARLMGGPATRPMSPSSAPRSSLLTPIG